MNNFQNNINPFERMVIINKLINAIDKELELTLIVISGNITKVYELIPKVFKYKNQNFYVKCEIDNDYLWIQYNGFDIINNKIYGIFDDVEEAKIKLSSILER